MSVDLVADTNIVFSALVKRGKIRRIILEEELLKLHIPEELAGEIHRHADKLTSYLSLSINDIHKLIDGFIEEATITHRREEYRHMLEKALSLVDKVDPTDAPFVALAMHLEIPLWTGDHGLLKLSAQTGFKHFVAVDTEGVEMLLNGVGLEEALGRMKEKYGQDKKTGG